jgi:hypothetical protein
LKLHGTLAKSNSKLRTRFAQRQFVVKINKLSKTDTTGPVLEIHVEKTRGFSIEPSPLVNPTGNSPENLTGQSYSEFISKLLPTTTETMCSQVNHLLSLKLPVRVKNRLLLKRWAMECRLEAVCLLLDEAEENGIVIKEGDIDLSVFDLSGFYLPEYNDSESDFPKKKSGE